MAANHFKQLGRDLPDSRTSRQSCEVIILGAGIAGLYAAYKLAPILGSDVCLVEKEQYLGGRILDVPENGQSPGNVFGLGPLRVTTDHLNMMALVREFNISLQAAPHDMELYHVRGQNFLNQFRAYDPGQCRHMCKQFPDLQCVSPNPDKHLWDKLRNIYQNLTAEGRSIPPDMTSFVLNSLGSSGLEFLEHSTRVKTPLGGYSTAGVMDFLKKGHLTVNPPAKLYPVGGMSAFSNAISASIARHGVRIFRETTVTEILTIRERVHNLRGSGAIKFRVKSANYHFESRKLIIAIDPHHLKTIEGSLANKIRKQTQFQMIAPVAVATVAAWWPHRWWNNTTARFLSAQSKFKSSEIPLTPYAAAQNVTRAVYMDDQRHLETWRSLAQQGDEVLANSVRRELQNVFGSIVPRPRSVKAQIWPNAWHFLKPESAFTNDEVEEWAKEPVAGLAVALAGDGYNPGWTAWCEGAILSAINTLQQLFDYNEFSDCTCDSRLFTSTIGMCSTAVCQESRTRREAHVAPSQFEITPSRF